MTACYLFAITPGEKTDSNLGGAQQQKNLNCNYDCVNGQVLCQNCFGNVKTFDMPSGLKVNEVNSFAVIAGGHRTKVRQKASNWIVRILI